MPFQEVQSLYEAVAYLLHLMLRWQGSSSRKQSRQQLTLQLKLRVLCAPPR